jgi:hypothetical protein
MLLVLSSAPKRRGRSDVAGERLSGPKHATGRYICANLPVLSKGTAEIPVFR